MNSNDRWRRWRWKNKWRRNRRKRTNLSLYSNMEKIKHAENQEQIRKKKSTSVLSKSGSLYKLLREETFLAAVVVRGR